MSFSPPMLHPPIQVDAEMVAAALERMQGTFAEVRRPSYFELVLGVEIEIPLTTVSMAGAFDSYIQVHPKGSDPATGGISLLLDSGCSVLILPDWNTLAALPDADTNYTILGTGNEPWGCPANIVRGPIELHALDGQVAILQDCVFYACTGANGAGQRTANFGAARLSPWTSSGWNTPAGVGATLMAPLAYCADHPFAEIGFAAAETIYSANLALKVSASSVLRLAKTEPAGYTMFAIVPDLMWMAVRPRSLDIGGTATGWPGSTSAIAVVDTGGTCAFLSDESGYVYDKAWPDPVTNPAWTSGSDHCQTTADAISIELGDDASAATYRYTIDPGAMPQSVRGQTLVMCRVNQYLWGSSGMNIGGISVLTNFVLIDHVGARVGFKPK